MEMDGDLPYIPPEIIPNILKYLPVKSLIRFQSASKHWKNIINTPSFVQHHLNNQTTKLLIHQTFTRKPPYFSLLDHNMQFHKYNNIPFWINSMTLIVASSNGLLCLYEEECLYEEKVKPFNISLWNPATTEEKHIRVDFSNCGFFGFGFSGVINDYKIVGFSIVDMICGAHVCSLSTASWRVIYPEILKGVDVYCHGITIDGVMFWYGSKSANDKLVMISLDLVTEVFTVTLSPVFVSGCFYVKLAVYKDKLAIIYHEASPKHICIYLRIMEDEGGWSLRWKYCLQDGYIFLYDDTYLWRNKIVYTHYFIPAFTTGPKRWLCLLDIITNERKRFAITEPQDGRGDRFYAFVYNHVESLVKIGNIEHY